MKGAEEEGEQQAERRMKRSQKMRTKGWLGGDDRGVEDVDREEKEERMKKKAQVSQGMCRFHKEEFKRPF